MNRVGILLIALVVIFAAITVRMASLVSMQRAPDQVVALLVDEQENSPSGRAPWETYVTEQGIPHSWILQRDLSLYTVRDMRSHFLAIVVPDGINRFVSEDTAALLTGYVRSGGVVLIVGDSGTLLYSNNRFANRAQLADLVGVEYLRFRLLGKKSYGHGVISFTGVNMPYVWHVPPGKLEDGNRISSYGYGSLVYALPETRAAAGTQVDAVSPLGPAFTERHLGAGTAFYIAPLLGYLRSIGDSFPMHIVMRHVLFDTAAVPHLVAAPDARGEVIFNWHIDSNAEWQGIPHFAAHGLLRHDVRYDFDITAGPDLAKAHDNLGFDACGKGERFVHELEPYGSIGSHGGWAHNWFARQVETGRLDERQMRSLIARNDACLASITHKPVLDYAAPVGVHPPEMTVALGSLGVRGYYYTGDTGTPPELAFFNGRLVSNSVWAFPIMPYGSVASFQEMDDAGLQPSSVERWLISTVDQAERDRSIYLMYSHVYDLWHHPQYVAPFAAFVDRVEKDQRLGLTTATTMVDASAFMNRFVQTRADFVRVPGGVVVKLANPQGLRDIAFALPRAWIGSSGVPSGVTAAGQDATFSYFAVHTNALQCTLSFTKTGRTS